MTALPQRLLCRNDCPVWLRGGTSSYSEECTARQKLGETLRSTFHHASFRPGQLEALLPVAHGQDVLVRMPTGGGKSLCMFLIPLSLGKAAMGIVISPLVGLIEQQVSSGNYAHDYNVVMYRYLSSRLLECLLFMHSTQNTCPT